MALGRTGARACMESEGPFILCTPVCTSCARHRYWMVAFQASVDKVWHPVHGKNWQGEGASCDVVRAAAWMAHCARLLVLCPDSPVAAVLLLLPDVPPDGGLLLGVRPGAGLHDAQPGRGAGARRLAQLPLQRELLLAVRAHAPAPSGPSAASRLESERFKHCDRCAQIFNGFIITYPDMPKGWRWLNRCA